MLGLLNVFDITPLAMGIAPELRCRVGAAILGVKDGPSRGDPAFVFAGETDIE